MRPDQIPEIIRAAGADAEAAYRAYFEAPGRARSTRLLYIKLARRYFDWAGRRGLTLEAIDAAALAAYGGEVAAAKSRQEALVYLSPVRGVLRHLAAAGILAADPCPPGQPNGRVAALLAAAGPPPPLPRSPEEWQDAVDAASAALALDALLQFGLIECDGPSLAVDVARCREILDRGRALGFVPASEGAGATAPREAADDR